MCSEMPIYLFVMINYDAKSKGKFGRQIHVDLWIDCTVWVHQLVLAEVNLSCIWKSWSVEYTTFAPATIAPMVNANVKHNPNPNPNPNLNPYPTLNHRSNNPIITLTLTLCWWRYHHRSNCHRSKCWITKVSKSYCSQSHTWLFGVWSVDGARLRAPDVDAEGGGVWACSGLHPGRRPRQAALAQEPQLRGKQQSCTLTDRYIIIQILTGTVMKYHVSWTAKRVIFSQGVIYII